MSALFSEWAKLEGKFAALTRRERAIVAATLVFGGGFLIFSFAVEPLLLKSRNAVRMETAARTELAQQQVQMALLKAQSADPDAVNRRRVAQARQDLAAVSGRLAGFEAGMVPPTRMQAFLEGLLARNRAVELLALKTLPVTLVGAQAKAEGPAGTSAQGAKGPARDNPGPENAGQASGDGIYQHGIEIRLAGDYNGLLNYLAEIERMPQRLLWNRIDFVVEKYPRNIMVVRVYTLSLDKNWLLV
jgi:MSHA biogenesis protein MshJ